MNLGSLMLVFGIRATKLHTVWGKWDQLYEFCTPFVCISECYTQVYTSEYNSVSLFVSECYTCFSACYTFKFIGDLTRNKSQTCHIQFNIYTAFYVTVTPFDYF